MCVSDRDIVCLVKGWGKNGLLVFDFVDYVDIVVGVECVWGFFVW